MWTRPYDPYIIAKTGGKYKHFARFLQKSGVERNVDRRCVSFGKMWRCGERPRGGKIKLQKRRKTRGVFHKVLHIVEKIRRVFDKRLKRIKKCGIMGL